jgi:hypothetical protein
MSTNRRDFLSMAAIGAALTPVIASAADSSVRAVAPARLAALASEPLLNRARANGILAEEKLDAVVASRPTNVYYLSNYYAINARQGSLDSTFAVLPRDPKLPVALVLGEFSYYYTATDIPLPPGVRVYLYSGGLNIAPVPKAKRSKSKAADAAPVPDAYDPASFFAVAEGGTVTPREAAENEPARSVARTGPSRKP